MSKTLKISVALATYQGMRHLNEQLRSLAEQTLLPTEVVVRDDGSTDATLSVLREFAVNAPFTFRILSNGNRLGFSDNFLCAAENCHYDLIAFCDQDDVWMPDKLEIASERLHRDGSLLALHRLLVTDGDLRPTGVIWTQEIEGDAVYEALKLDPYINGWGNSMLFRRELVHLIPRTQRPQQPERPELPLSHDTWIYVLAAALGRVSHIFSPLLHYRQHTDNTYGVKAPGIGDQIKQRLTPPTYRLREQGLFNDQMVELFLEVASRNGPYADKAGAAAVRFAERRELLRTRARIYTGSSVKTRLDAFTDVRGMTPDGPPRLGQRVKEMLVGVSGLSKLTSARLDV